MLAAQHASLHRRKGPQASLPSPPLSVPPHIPRLPPLGAAIVEYSQLPLPDHPLFHKALSKPGGLDLSDIARWKSEPPFEVDEDPNDLYSVAYFSFTQSLGFVLHGIRLREQKERDVQRRIEFEEGKEEAMDGLRNEVSALLEGWERVLKMLSEEYVDHPFFNLENQGMWISPVAFQAYMGLTYGSLDEHPLELPLELSRLSCGPDPVQVLISQLSRLHAEVPQSPLRHQTCPHDPRVRCRLTSPTKFTILMLIPIISPHTPCYLHAIPYPTQSSDLAPLLETNIERPASPSRAILSKSDTPGLLAKKPRGKGKKKADPLLIEITRQHSVNKIVTFSAAQSTWNVPREPITYLVDLSASEASLTTSAGKAIPLDAYIRSQDQESWGGSVGHKKGDTWASGFTSDLSKAVYCRRAHLTCNDCERFEVDEAAMRELWNHELNANEREAASAPGIMSRFYTRIRNSKCKVRCDGAPTLIRRSQGPSAHGKHFFVGCSKRTRAERDEHILWLIPPNIDETTLKFVMDHDGILPTVAENLNDKCVLTVHLRVGLTNCPYSHILDGRIIPAKIQRRKCPTEMIILVPVEPTADTLHKAMVILRNPHNHPAHPTTKPSVQDQVKLTAAVNAAGLTGLTVQKLLNAPSTSIVYGGARVSETSPAFTASRKVRDFISKKKKEEHPCGMGWEGVLYQLAEREVKLPTEDRYIHTAIAKNGFRLVWVPQCPQEKGKKRMEG
ncbi:hypothetical protein DFH07DRAFT_980918, partial [Mycena maculata]